MIRRNLIVLTAAGFLGTAVPEFLATPELAAMPLGTSQFWSSGSDLQLASTWVYNPNKNGKRYKKKHPGFGYHHNGWWYSKPWWTYNTPNQAVRRNYQATPPGEPNQAGMTDDCSFWYNVYGRMPVGCDKYGRSFRLWDN